MTDLPAPMSPPVLAPPASQARWRFLRDVAVFEAKLALNNVHNFFQVPLTLGVAAIDLLLKGEVEGSRFYRLVEVGRTIDAVVSRLEAVIVREYQRGGTAATVKHAVDKAIDELQTQTSTQASRAAAAIKAAVARMLHEQDAKRD